MSQPFRQHIFHALTDARATGADLPPEIRAAEPDNFMRHVSALSLTKMADGLLDPKLVLSWVLA
ncbi:MFS transporter, partial [Thioclava sp. BHET1]